MRSLIVNADDFGLSIGVNDGIERAHRSGIVRSASLMVRQPAVEDAVARARTLPYLGVGLHVDLGEWRYEAGDWLPVYEVVDTGDPDAVAREVDAQLSRFGTLLGRGPTHLDSHQHVHAREPARSVLLERAEQLGVVLRHETPGVRYVGAFYGQTTEGAPLPDALRPDRLVELLDALEPGFSELSCHPASVVDVATQYASERLVELATLCDQRVVDAVGRLGVRLCSFEELGPFR